jgi:hypothetical protein
MVASSRRCWVARLRSCCGARLRSCCGARLRSCCGARVVVTPSASPRRNKQSSLTFLGPQVIRTYYSWGDESDLLLGPRRGGRFAHLFDDRARAGCRVERFRLRGEPLQEQAKALAVAVFERGEDALLGLA